MKLFDIPTELAALQDLLTERDGDVSDPEIAATVDAWFAELTEDEGGKLDGYLYWISQNETEAAGAKVQAEFWAKKQKARENAAKRLKDRLKQYLEFTGRTKVQTTTGRTIAIQANGGLVPLWIDPETPPEQVDEAFRKVRVEFDRDAIREFLDNGNETAFARLEPRGTRLAIR